METLLACPACQAKNHKFIRKCKDFTVSSEEFCILQCSNCSLLFTNPRPDKKEIAKYYESQDYISHSNTNKGVANKIYRLVRNHAIQNKLKLITRLVKNVDKNILDIGCGTGEFLGACKNSGWKSMGIEPNEGARKQAINNWGLNVFPENQLENLTSIERPGIITMWHVLEHVHELHKRLEQVANLLQKEGVLIIAVPNPESWDASHYQDFWAAYDVPRHLYHFTPAVLINLICSFGFTHLESRPMPFDSFYVSMLSEKYKHSKLQLIKAFLKGLKSNLITGSKAEKYSSVIYIFKKQDRS